MTLAPLYPSLENRGEKDATCINAPLLYVAHDKTKNFRLSGV
jgi:hypothetical protein